MANSGWPLVQAIMSMFPGYEDYFHDEAIMEAERLLGEYPDGWNPDLLLEDCLRKVRDRDEYDNEDASPDWDEYVGKLVEVYYMFSSMAKFAVMPVPPRPWG